MPQNCHCSFTAVPSSIQTAKQIWVKSEGDSNIVGAGVMGKIPMKFHFCWHFTYFLPNIHKNYTCVTKCPCFSLQGEYQWTLFKLYISSMHVKCPQLLTFSELLFPSSYFWRCTVVEWCKSIVQDCQKWQKIWGEMSKGEWRLNKRRLAKCQLGEMFPKCGWKSKIYEETFLQKLSLRQAL